MKKILITLIAMIPAFSFSDSLFFGVYTTHFDKNSEWNENNRLLAVETNGYVFASFVNSHGFSTYLAAKEHKITKYSSLIYGISYGYDARCLKFVSGGCYAETYTASFLPAAALKLSVNRGPVSLNAIVADYVNLSIGFNF